MKKYKISLLAISLMVLICGCGTNGSLNENLNTKSVLLSSESQRTSEQEISALMPVVSDKIQKEQILDAKPTIEKVLNKLACTSHKNRAILYKYAINDGIFKMYPLPLSSMKNHVYGCVKITRINKYKYIAKNAFSFEVTFESIQSEEVSRKYFEIQKQSENDWLISKYSWTL